MTDEKKQPEKTIRVGQIVATIWKNDRKEGQEYDTFSINIVKSYKDKEDNWKNTNNFQLNDLPKVELATNEAFRYLALKVEQE